MIMFTGWCSRVSTLTPSSGSSNKVMVQPLDRGRALWEMWVVEGLVDGRWAIVSKMHHCMVDGISGTDLMAVVLDRGTQAIGHRLQPPTATH